MRIAVGVATLGRPSLLQVMLAEIAQQSRHADLIVVSSPSSNDVVGVNPVGTTELIIGPHGTCPQRNAILDRARERDIDIVVFFDDDFLPEKSYLEKVEQTFSADPDIVLTTGLVIADGIMGPGLTVEEARRALANVVAVDGAKLHPVTNGYGCNMAVRLSVVEAARCRFDERLPLYGWLEDVDFSHRLAQHGRLAKVPATRGVHLGIKQGRQSGVRLGYSQVANAIYLARKGTCPWARAARLIGRNILANSVRSIRPEPYVDRVGRATGNVKAFRDLLLGRLAPERVLEL